MLATLAHIVIILYKGKVADFGLSRFGGIGGEEGDGKKGGGGVENKQTQVKTVKSE